MGVTQYGFGDSATCPAAWARLKHDEEREEAAIQAEAEAIEEWDRVMDSDSPWKNPDYQEAVYELNTSGKLNDEQMAKIFWLASSRFPEMKEMIDDELMERLYRKRLSGNYSYQ